MDRYEPVVKFSPLRDYYAEFKKTGPGDFPGEWVKWTDAEALALENRQLKSLRQEKMVPWSVVEAYITARNNYASSMSPFSEATNQEELLAIYEEAEQKLRSYA